MDEQVQETCVRCLNAVPVLVYLNASDSERVSARLRLSPVVASLTCSVT